MTCELTYAWNPTTRECEKCKLGCEVCDTNDKANCSECSTGYYLDLDTNACVTCVYPCETCLNKTYCYTCGYDKLVNNEVRRIRAPTCAC